MNRRDFIETLAGVCAGAFGSSISSSVIAAPNEVKFATTTGAVGLQTQVISRKGLAKAYDLSLSVNVLTPASAEKMVLLSQADAGPFPILSAAAVNTQGQDIICFGPLLYMHSYVLVWKEAPYQELSDLKGKRISLLNKFSGAYRGMQLIASWNGLDLEHDFQLVTSPPPAIITFLQRKQVDAIVMHEPLVSKLLASGKFRILLGMNDEWKKRMKGNWLFLALAAHRSWLERNTATARRLAEMILKSSRLIKEDPSLISAEADFLSLKTKGEIDLAVERMPKIFPTEWDAATIGNAMDAVHEGVQLKQIPAVPSFEFMRVLT